MPLFKVKGAPYCDEYVVEAANEDEAEELVRAAPKMKSDTRKGKVYFCGHEEQQTMDSGYAVEPFDGAISDTQTLVDWMKNGRYV